MGTRIVQPNKPPWVLICPLLKVHLLLLLHLLLVVGLWKVVMYNCLSQLGCGSSFEFAGNVLNVHLVQIFLALVVVTALYSTL